MLNNKCTSIILPCFNEKQNVLELISSIDEILGENHDYELIVVDDNSPDGTYEAVCNLKNSRVRPLLRTSLPSLAGSILDGIRTSKGELLVVMDTDFNHDPKYLPFMIKNLDYWDCVTGSRFQYGGMMESRSRTLLSWVFNVATRAVTGGMITDNLYGYYAIKKDILIKNNLCHEGIFKGYGNYFIRLMFYLQRAQVSILQFPAVNGKRRYGEGNSAFFGVFFQYTADVLKLTLTERIFSYAHKNRKLPGLRE
ncbi:MAG: glycosyltransferase [Bdellovibrionota bacterium]